MDQRVLVAIDDSTPATAALEHALKQLSDTETTITVLHVIDEDEPDGSLRQRLLSEAYHAHCDAAEQTAKTILKNAQTSAEDYGVDITTAIRYGMPARQITQYANENDIDRIIMGTHGRSGLSRLLLGSLSDLVMQRSSVPVTLVREPTTTGQTGTPLTEIHNRESRESSAPITDNSPTKRWCPYCAVTLSTRLEFCPGCLGETRPVAGTPG